MPDGTQGGPSVAFGTMLIQHVACWAGVRLPIRLPLCRET